MTAGPTTVPPPSPDRPAAAGQPSRRRAKGGPDGGAGKGTAASRLERKYRLLHDRMLQGVVYLDGEGRILSLNPAAERILGRGQEACGESGLGAADRPALRSDGSPFPDSEHPFLVTLRTGRELRDAEVGLYNPREGDYRWLNVHAFPLCPPAGEGADRVCLLVEDITERRGAERRQSLAAEILAMINDAASLADTIAGILRVIQRETGFAAVGIRLRSGDDFPYFVQHGFSNDFLLTEERLTVRAQGGGVCLDDTGKASLECTCGLVISGRTDPTNPLFTPGGSFWINDALPLLDLPADRDPRIRPRNRCIREGFRSIALIPIRVKREIVGLLQLNDRRQDRFTLALVTFFEGLGASLGIALSRKRAEEAIRERTSQLEAANRELDSFCYSVSHDLRAPLRAIDGYARIILRQQGERFDENTRRQFELIRRSTATMGQLIDDLLAFSRMGREALSRASLDVGALARDAWEGLRAAQPDRPLELEIQPLPAGVGDGSLIRQVFVNILSNAIKFTRTREVARIEVGGCEGEGETVFYVRDNGVGFDMQYHDRLFGVFQRGHSAEEYEGTGVGLAIVQRIVNRHGGRVWAESEPGRGATFYFSLPARRP